MLEIYPQVTHSTVKNVAPSISIDIDKACNEIHASCGKQGADPQIVVKVMASRCPNQRTMIVHRYKELYKKALVDDVKGATTGDFGYLLQMVCMTVPQAEALLLNDALKARFGQGEVHIYPILLGRSNEEITLLKRTYMELYQTDLSMVVKQRLSGSFRTVCLRALREPLQPYDRSNHTELIATEDADLLYRVSEGSSKGVDEETFVRILLSSPPAHIKRMNASYISKYKHDIIKVIKMKFTGTAENALVFYVRLSIEPWVMLAEYYENTMKGIGTDEEGLSGAVIRYHSYLCKIQPLYEKIYKQTLRSRIIGDTSKDYQSLLVKLIEAPAHVGRFA
jgi:hypothetical protein